MTRAQIREKYGISMLESPSVANKELSEKEAAEYEDCVSLLLRTFDEIDENIEKFCSRCNYYRTTESNKCDSVIHGCSYGVNCRYIEKAKGISKQKEISN
mgnify:FL=1